MMYLTEILGSGVYDSGGKKVGTVAELAVLPVAHPPRVGFLVLKAGKGKGRRLISWADVASLTSERIRLRIPEEQIADFQPDEALLLLRKDLLDQQIIDVHGRKVVRVNDVSLEEKPVDHQTGLVLNAVDIGVSGALRRLLSGAVPRVWLRKLEARVKHTAIPWEFVNLLEPDPLRRVKLNISHKALGQLHPADLADIVEDLAPNERQAIFRELDDEAAAEALSEVDPKLQVSIVESLEPARAADIVEEMPPDAAADLLADLSEETTSGLLHDMDREDAQEIGELLEFPEASAGGMMTTDYIALPDTADVSTARNLLLRLPELPDNLSSIFLVDATGKLAGSLPLIRLLVAAPEQRLVDLKLERTLTVEADSSEEDVVELFDKYNLLALSVVDEERHLLGVVTVDDVVSVLHKKA